MNEGRSTARTFLVITVVLHALLALTIAVSWMSPGPVKLTLAMLIAAAKCLLIAVFFMHLRRSKTVVRLFSAAGVVWLGILIVLTLADLITRG